MSEQQPQQRGSTRSLKQSFIQEQQSPFVIRVLKKIDIFSFIPVPRDDSVSTRQSLVGTAVFFLIFLAYIIVDFYQFVSENPPNAQNFYTNLNDEKYPLPRFAITYMRGQQLEKCDPWNPFISFSLSQQSKDKGSELKQPVKMHVNNFTTGHTANEDQVDWINSDTKSFYNILRTSTKDLQAKGLLYSTSNALYGKIKIQMCNFSIPNSGCATQQQIEKFCAEGRIFLFVQNIYDTTDFSQQDQQNSPHFFIYNFFLQPYLYKRVTFNFQVVQTVVLPDYFFRFKTQRQTRLQISSYIQQSSNVVLNAVDTKTEPLDMMGIQFQLSPQILNVRVTYRTLLDHISMWGAFWGVLFAIFALLFLSYNRKKFYKKNPDWNKFKRNNFGGKHQEYYHQERIEQKRY